MASRRETAESNVTSRKVAEARVMREAGADSAAGGVEEAEAEADCASKRCTGLRIGDIAARAGVSTRTLRYYEELGLLTPSGHTAGGERRYEPQDLQRLERILELKELVGMNLDEIRSYLSSEIRLDELRVAYHAHKDDASGTARDQRREILKEALDLQVSLIDRLDAKLDRLSEFRSSMSARVERCRELLDELSDVAGG